MPNILAVFEWRSVPIALLPSKVIQPSAVPPWIFSTESPMRDAIQSSSLSTSAPTKQYPGGARTIALSSDPSRVGFAFDAVSQVFSTARRVIVPIGITWGMIRPTVSMSVPGGLVNVCRGGIAIFAFVLLPVIIFFLFSVTTFFSFPVTTFFSLAASTLFALSALPTRLALVAALFPAAVGTAFNPMDTGSTPLA